jgi:pSer/pThr/pTyr-binding forkhead associated (FHA) protein
MQSDFVAPKKISPKKLNIPPLNYETPSWGMVPSGSYYFEIIKNGASLGRSKIEKAQFIFGRLPVCDIELDHQSISRYHAIVQFRNDEKAFLFDLGSTHGTFLNKSRINSRQYTPLSVGDMIRFGGSARTFVFQGPPSKNMTGEERTSDISWGFKEDAYEGDEWGGSTIQNGKSV